MADQCVKRHDDFDLEPSKRKPCTIESSESSSALQHAGRKHGPTTRLSTCSRLRDERKRLLYVMRQVSDGSIIKKIREQLESDLVSRLIQSLAGIFNSEDYPPPSHKYMKKCTEAAERSTTPGTTMWHPLTLRQEHKVERTSKAVCGTGWECTECGLEWVREYDDYIDGDDVGYCYKGPHEVRATQWREWPGCWRLR